VTIFEDTQVEETVERQTGVPRVFQAINQVVKSPLFPMVMKTYGKGLGVALLTTGAAFTVQWIKDGGLEDIMSTIN
jgi:hypothetical protein